MCIQRIIIFHLPQFFFLFSSYAWKFEWGLPHRWPMCWRRHHVFLLWLLSVWHHSLSERRVLQWVESSPFNSLISVKSSPHEHLKVFEVHLKEIVFLPSVPKVKLSERCLQEDDICLDVNAKCRGGICQCNGQFDVVGERCGELIILQLIRENFLLLFMLTHVLSLCVLPQSSEALWEQHA